MLSRFKKSYNVILEIAVKQNIDAIAKEQERSSSWLINHVLKKYIEDYNKRKELDIDAINNKNHKE